MNKICVYAIAKNESQFVDTWVKSVQSADHVIVLDTGSEDDTVSKLRRLGVEVHETSYEQFRFDTARNDALDLVPDEYNIRVSIDLDEVFEPDNWADILREQWDDEIGRVIYNYVWQHTEDGKPALTYFINKIHGKDPNLRWAGAVHEHLTYMDTGSRKIPKAIDLTKVLTIHHYPDWSKDRKFYKELAEIRMSETADDPQAYILYGNEERVKGDPRKAIEAYEVALEKFNIEDKTELAGIYFALGDAYRRADDGINAMINFSNGIAVNKYYRDNYYGLGHILYASKLFDAAIGVLEEGLKTSVRFFFWMEDNFTWTYAMYSLLGSAYFAKGDIEKAFINASKALQYESSNPVLLKQFNRYWKILNNEEDTEEA